MDESHELKHPARVTLNGVAVREEDIEPQPGLHIAALVCRVCAIIILLLALWQFAAWWMDRPPGGVGVGVLVGDTVRLIVFSGLLWAAGALADLMVKTHYDVRAGRVLMARQTHLLHEMAVASGAIPKGEPDGHRRAADQSSTTRRRA
jgi:hypothetical protein